MTPTRAALLERFMSKVRKGHDDGSCWEWSAGHNPEGYGRFYQDKNHRCVAAHRAAYELLVEPIPYGLHLDHLCRNPGCVNPAHLEPVTPRENWLRGENNRAIIWRANTCAKGHPLVEGSYTKNAPHHWRRCKICRSEESARRRVRRHLARAAKQQAGAIT